MFTKFKIIEFGFTQNVMNNKFIVDYEGLYAITIESNLYTRRAVIFAALPQ